MHFVFFVFDFLLNASRHLGDFRGNYRLAHTWL